MRPARPVTVTIDAQQLIEARKSAHVIMGCAKSALLDLRSAPIRPGHGDLVGFHTAIIEHADKLFRFLDSLQRHSSL